MFLKREKQQGEEGIKKKEKEKLKIPCLRIKESLAEPALAPRQELNGTVSAFKSAKKVSKREVDRSLQCWVPCCSLFTVYKPLTQDSKRTVLSQPTVKEQFFLSGYSFYTLGPLSPCLQFHPHSLW